MRIGLALSGGGIRALVYHLGMLARLSETELWENITHISTVSGGSLCIALVFEKSGKKWPGATEYKENTLPQISDLLTNVNLQRQLFIHTCTRPWRLLGGRAHVLGVLLKELWNVTSNVSDIPLHPRWTINTTCYQTGKNFRFSAKRMGDYVTKYVLNPSFPLCDAVAASAGFPVGIGPLKVNTGKYIWQTHDGQQTIQPLFSSYHLWDGGVYENLGLEALYKIGEGPRKDIDFCLISDASAPLAIVSRTSIPIWRHVVQSKRLVDIPSEQVRSLRARESFDYFADNKCGGYLRLGESVKQVMKNLKMPTSGNIPVEKTLSDEEVMEAAQFATSLSVLKKDEFKLLFRHGYETCSIVLAGNGQAEFHSWDDRKEGI